MMTVIDDKNLCSLSAITYTTTKYIHVYSRGWDMERGSIMTEKKVYTLDWAGRPLTIETGQLAKQANGAVLVRYGETTILSTATSSKNSRGLDFFPLTVNYEERMYAVGKIPGGFLKREGRPSDKAVLTSRLIDRPIRPLFADGFRNDVQVISMVMSVDQDCSSEIHPVIFFIFFF